MDRMYILDDTEMSRLKAILQDGIVSQDITDKQLALRKIAIMMKINIESGMAQKGDKHES